MRTFFAIGLALFFGTCAYPSVALATPIDDGIELGVLCTDSYRSDRLTNSCKKLAQWVADNPDDSDDMKRHCALRARQDERCRKAFDSFRLAFDAINAARYSSRRMTKYKQDCENGDGKACFRLANGHEYRGQTSENVDALLEGCALQFAQACFEGTRTFRRSEFVQREHFERFAKGLCKANRNNCLSAANDAWPNYMRSVREGDPSEKDAYYTRTLLVSACEKTGLRTVCLPAGNMVSRGQGGAASDREGARLFQISCDMHQEAIACYSSVVFGIRAGDTNADHKANYLRMLNIGCNANHQRSCDLLEDLR